MDQSPPSQPVGPGPAAGPAIDRALGRGVRSRRDVLRATGIGFGALALAPVLGMAGAPGQAQSRLTARASGMYSPIWIASVSIAHS